MGANAQTAVPDFTAGQVLTAAQMTEVNTGIPVFADTTARDAAFGGAGEKTLAEGQFAYIEATNTTQYYDGAAWQSVGVAPGLVLVKTQTIGSAVSSVEVTSAFSSTYDNYKIIISGGASSTACELRLQLGATTTGYYSLQNRRYYSNGSAENSHTNNGAYFEAAGSGNTNGLNACVELGAPNLAKNTTASGPIVYVATNAFAGNFSGYVNDTTQYTAFTIITQTGTLTGGTIRVYGYANS
jgi:hypothetical protein